MCRDLLIEKMVDDGDDDEFESLPLIVSTSHAAVGGSLIKNHQLGPVIG